MFTIRFNQHHGDGYTSYSCRAYRVKTTEGEAEIHMTFPDGEMHVEQVGENTPYDVAYVTNGDSRTIDVVREPFNAS